jgi:hypothetical protein
MIRADHAAGPSGDSQSITSGDTEELTWELQQKKPDMQRIRWLVEDMQADVRTALRRAKLNENDLLKNPQLRALGLQKYLQH